MQLTAEVYDTFLSILDEALELTKGALEVAAAPAPVPQAPEVHLTKVASHVYEKTASALMRTGVFDSMTQDEMRKTLEEAGESGHLAILEKLASRAAFPLNVRMDLGGELVERQTPQSDIPKDASKGFSVWRTALDEARRDNG